jgi:hypothetical protein
MSAFAPSVFDAFRFTLSGAVWLCHIGRDDHARIAVLFLSKSTASGEGQSWLPSRSFLTTNSPLHPDAHARVDPALRTSASARCPQLAQFAVQTGGLRDAQRRAGCQLSARTA